MIHKDAPSVDKIENQLELDNYETLLKKTLIRVALTDTTEERNILNWLCNILGKGV